MAKIICNQQSGFTLIELILIVLVVGIFFPLALGLFMVDLEEPDTPIVALKAGLLAEGMLDEISARQFDENSTTFSPPYDGTETWTPPADLGLDGGENAANKYTFDDVDDFINYSKTVVDPEYGNFTVSVQSIFYVDDVIANDALDTELATSSGLKRVTIRISHALLGNQDFVTVFGSESAR